MTGYDLSPLVSDLNSGQSYGMKYPVVFGWRQDRGLWMAWDRHTGEVVLAAPPRRNVHGWDASEQVIAKAAEPTGYAAEFNPAELDVEP